MSLRKEFEAWWRTRGEVDESRPGVKSFAFEAFKAGFRIGDRGPSTAVMGKNMGKPVDGLVAATDSTPRHFKSKPSP